MLRNWRSTPPGSVGTRPVLRRSVMGASTLAVGLAVICAELAAPAEARLSGSVHVGRSSSSTTVTNGRVQTRSQGGSLNAYFGRRPSVHRERVPDRRSPYGRLGYGRGPGYNYGSPHGSYGYDGVHSSTWSGSIDRNFQQMRRTSPYPWRFAGGAFNPRPIHRGFGYSTYHYPAFGDFFYPGYAFGFSAGLYTSYVPSVYSAYGSWYPPYLPVERVYIIERERIRERDDRDEDSRRSSAEDRREARDRPEASSSREGEYYLAPPPRDLNAEDAVEPAKGETVEQAVAAIRSAWLNGDHARLLARIVEKGKVRIYLKGKYKYSVDTADFGQMSADAMERIDTTGFTLDRVRKLSEDRAFVSGKHTYLDPERQQHTVHVSYGLIRAQGRWQISEAGSGTEPITSHAD